jgi:hypothetical protein
VADGGAVLATGSVGSAGVARAAVVAGAVVVEE